MRAITYFMFITMIGGHSLAQGSHNYLLNSNSTDTLTLPAIANGDPDMGKKVIVTAPEYQGTEVRHTIYLPEKWNKNWKNDNERLPIIFEYTGNYYPKSGSTGEVEGAGLGYCLTGGKYIWVALPYINESGTSNEKTWWGDKKATIDYTKKHVPQIIEEFGGDTKAVFLCGFSRGAIGVNYLGLSDDDVAGFWTAFITHDHFDGVKEWGNTTWGTPYEKYKKGAVVRLKRVNKRPYLVIQNGEEYGTQDFVRSVFEEYDNFEFLQINTTDIFRFFPNEIAISGHTDRWPLFPSNYRTETWEWMNKVIEAKSVKNKDK